MAEVGANVWIKDDVLAWIPGQILSIDGDKASVEPDSGGKPVDVTLKTDSAGELTTVKLRNTDLGSSDRKQVGVDDLINLTHLHEPAILHVLQMRYAKDLIYTSTGPILLAVNPFQRLPLYTRDILQQYYSIGLLKSQGIDAPPLAPHVWDTADNAYRCMRSPDEAKGTPTSNQSVLISGESGAGKTESTKLIMRYVCWIGRPKRHQRSGSSHAMLSPRLGSALDMDQVASQAAGPASPSPSTPAASGAGAGSTPAGAVSTPTGSSRAAGSATGEASAIERRILDSNPILEAFGNAKTSRNENSSRFGKFITLQFNRAGELVGGSIETYLLEKVRVAAQSKGERNFHIFYQLHAGLSDEDKETLGLDLKPLEEHRLTNQSGCYTLRDVGDDEEYRALEEGMETMGIGRAERLDVWKAVAGVLHLGDVQFEAHKVPGADGGDGAKITEASRASATSAARLLGLTLEGMEDALTSKMINAAGEKYKVLFSPEQATSAADALAKDIYGKLFLWLVKKVNLRIRAEQEQVASFIGVLDIFGFEHFEHNSFEQLCINYANETLQQQFNQFVFKLEQEEYEREGIDWSSIDFPDNQDCLDLIEGKKPPGILALLDEQCLLGQRATNKGFASKLVEQLGKHARFSASAKLKARSQFIVKHYAGQVKYSTGGFIEKNRDQMHQEATDCVKGSAVSLLQVVYGVEAAAKGGAAAGGDDAQAAGGAAAAGASSEGAAGGKKGGKGGKKKGKGKKGGLMSDSVGSQFKSQLKSLLSVIRSTSPHYVRCIKPNAKQMPKEFERTGVVSQLRCGGVLEAVRVARLGYPVRYLHEDFLRQYQVLLSLEHKRELLSGLMGLGKRAKGAGKSAGKSGPVLSVEEGQQRSRRLMELIEDPLDPDSFQVGKTKVFFRKAGVDEMERRRQHVLRGSAVRAQSAVRRWLALRTYARIKHSCSVAQRVVRGFLARRTVRRMRRELAATRTQAFARRAVARLAFLRYRAAVTKLQARARGAAQVARFAEIRRRHYATKLVAWRRGRLQSRRFAELRGAAVRIQCCARQRQARDKLAKLKKEAKEVGALRDNNVRLQREVRELKAMLRAWESKAKELNGGNVVQLDDEAVRAAEDAMDREGEDENEDGEGGPKEEDSKGGAGESKEDAGDQQEEEEEDKEQRPGDKAVPERGGAQVSTIPVELKAMLEATRRRADAAEQRAKELEAMLAEAPFRGAPQGPVPQLASRAGGGTAAAVAVSAPAPTESGGGAGSVGSAAAPPAGGGSATAAVAAAAAAGTTAAATPPKPPLGGGGSAPGAAALASAQGMEFAHRLKDRYERQIARYKREAEASAKRVSELRDQATVAQASRQRAEHEVHALRGSHKHLLEENREMKKKLSESAKDNPHVVALQQKVADLQKAKDKAADMAVGLQEQVRELQQQAHGTEAKIADMVDDLEALRGQKRMDNDVKLALAQRLDTVMVERGEALDELRFKTEELHQEKRARQQLEARLKQAVGAMGSPEPAGASNAARGKGRPGAGAGAGSGSGAKKTQASRGGLRRAPPGSATGTVAATTPDAGGGRAPARKAVAPAEGSSKPKRFMGLF